MSFPVRRFVWASLSLAVLAGPAALVGTAQQPFSTPARPGGQFRDANRDTAADIGRMLLQTMINSDPNGRATSPNPSFLPANSSPTQPNLGPPTLTRPSLTTPGTLGKSPTDFNVTKPLPNQTVKLDKGQHAEFALTQQLGERLNDWIDLQVKELQGQVIPYFVTEPERQQLLGSLNGKVGRQYLIDLQDALIDEDPEELERAAKKVELPLAQRESLVKRTALTQTAKRALRDLNAGRSPIALNRETKQIMALLESLQMSTFERNKVRDQLDGILAAARVRHAIEMSTIQSKTVMDWPAGLVPVVYDPLVPAGQKYLINDYALLVGIAGQGSLHCDMSTAARVIGLPIAEGEPVPEYRETSLPLTGTILVNPADNRLPVSFLANSVTRRIQAGETQSIAPPGTATTTVEFDRGGGNGQARYNLGAGVFIFNPTARGWDLFKLPYQITIDNSENSNDFNFVINDRRDRVAAYDSKTITAETPILLVFDRGDNRTISRRLLFNGVYKVGINSRDTLWDLFESQERTLTADAGTPASLSTPSSPPNLPLYPVNLTK